MQKNILYLLLLLNPGFLSQAVSSQDMDSFRFRIHEITISGNRVTAESIILRELEFSVGDSLTPAQIIEKFEKSENNLRNTLLFNFVDLNYRISAFNIQVRIELTERWYIWPVPILEIGDRNLSAWLKDPSAKKLNYGSFLNWNNFRGKRELLQMKLRLGYREQYSLNYMTGNLDRDKKHGVNILVNRFRQKEIILRSENDKPVYLSNENDYLLKSFEPMISYQFRPAYNNLYIFGLAYFNAVFTNDEFSEEFMGNPEGMLKYFSLNIAFENDTRDYKIYPTDGHLFRAELMQQGLGIIKNFDFRKTYLTLISSFHHEVFRNIIFDNAAKLRITKDERLPNIFTEAIGYDTYLRGFEYYTINGSRYYTMVTGMKYALLKPTVVYLNAFRREEFRKSKLAVYTGVFTDIAYIDGEQHDLYNNRLPDSFLWSSGIGIDFVSYYDQVLRFEFTINNLGEPGFYLHFETPWRRWY